MLCGAVLRCVVLCRIIQTTLESSNPEFSKSLIDGRFEHFNRINQGIKETQGNLVLVVTGQKEIKRVLGTTVSQKTGAQRWQ